jgi:hypothetical protein
LSCTDCGRKGGCESRKQAMFSALDETLARLYPTRRWSERDEGAAFAAGVDAGEGEALAAALAGPLRAATTFVPGAPEETCDYVYVLCLGRTPSLIDLREDRLAPADAEAARAAISDGPVEELYLRVALSTLARVAAVQEVRVAARADGDGQPNALTIIEAPRAGVFDPILLPRLRTLVGVLAAHHLRHLDFGEIVEPPPGFDPGDYATEWGRAPAIANYLFYPQAPGTITTATLT